MYSNTRITTEASPSSSSSSPSSTSSSPPPIRVSSSDINTTGKQATDTLTQVSEPLPNDKHASADNTKATKSAEEYQGPSEEEISRLYSAALRELDRDADEEVKVTASEHEIARKIINEYEGKRAGEHSGRDDQSGEPVKPDDVANATSTASSSVPTTRFDEAPNPPSGHFPAATTKTTHEAKPSPLPLPTSIASPPVSSIHSSSHSPSPSQQPQSPYQQAHAAHYNTYYGAYMPSVIHTPPSPGHFVNASNMGMGMPPFAMSQFMNPMMMPMPAMQPTTTSTPSTMPAEFNRNNFQPFLNHTQQFNPASPASPQHNPSGVASPVYPSLESMPIETLQMMYHMMSGNAMQCQTEMKVQDEVKRLKKKLKKAKATTSRGEEKLQDIKKAVRDAKKELAELKESEAEAEQELAQYKQDDEKYQAQTKEMEAEHEKAMADANETKRVLQDEVARVEEQIATLRCHLEKQQDEDK